MFNILTPTKSAVERQRFTVIQAAKHLGVTREYIYQLVRAHKIASHQYLGRTCIYVEDCVLHRTPKGMAIKGKRRTKEEIAKEKKRIYQRKLKRRKKREAIEALPPEEKQKHLRKLNRNKATKYRKKVKERRKLQEKLKCRVTTDDQQE